MAKLTKSARAAIPTSKFAGPGRSFPFEDKAHARAAIMLSGHASKSCGDSCEGTGGAEWGAPAQKSRRLSASEEITLMGWAARSNRIAEQTKTGALKPRRKMQRGTRKEWDFSQQWLDMVDRINARKSESAAK